MDSADDKKTPPEAASAQPDKAAPDDALAASVQTPAKASSATVDGKASANASAKGEDATSSEAAPANGPKPPPHPLSMAAHPTIWTIGLALALATAMSFMPLPESLRPFPFQKDGVLPTLSATLLPKQSHKTLDEIRHEKLPPPVTTATQDELAGLLALAAPPPSASAAMAPESDGDSGVPEVGEGQAASTAAQDGGAPDPAAAQTDASGTAVADVGIDGGEAEGNQMQERPSDPAYWLATRSAPPLAWLSAGVKEKQDFVRIEGFSSMIGLTVPDIEESCRDAASPAAAKDSAAERPAAPSADGEAAGRCGVLALDPFFDAIEEVVAGRRALPVRIAHFGNSLIASDFVAATIRRELSERYGSGGTGFLLVDRPTRISGNFDRTGMASEEGWEVALLTDKGERVDFGLAGARFVGNVHGGKGASVRFDLKGVSSAEVFWIHRKDSGEIEVAVDGHHLHSIHTKGEARESAVTPLKIPAGSKELTLTAKGGPVELYGVSLENGRPGIVHDTYGLAGGTADVFLQANEAVFRQQLQARAPTLAIVMLGGNETYEMTRGWMDEAKARRTVVGFIQRIREDAPDAACLITSQLDAGVKNAAGEITPRPFAEEVRNILREEALSHGCAFWDMFAAMGGQGSVARWFAADAMNEDLVHPRIKGAEALGHALVIALEKARLKRPGPALAVRDDPPGIGGGERLDGFFRKLDDLKSGRRVESVNVVQIGASHTAAHFFTDQARKRLGEVFGVAGRGFVAAGKPSKRLANAGVDRQMNGRWKVEDARDHVHGGAFGLTGIRAEGMPGSSHVWQFGIGEKDLGQEGVLTLHWLDGKDLHGQLSVKVDGNEPEDIRMGQTDLPHALKLHRIDVKGPTHSIQVTNASPDKAKLMLFGASLDLKVPGIRWDALGLPGATARLADTFDEEVFSQALADRHADLIVTFYGTNEAALDRLSGQEMAKHYRSVIRKFRAASPGADCLVIGPTDRLAPKKGPQALAPGMALSNATAREVAWQEGCAFWSSRSAMGGVRSMKRWQEAGLGNRDGVHLTPKGYAVLADGLADALLQEWEARQENGEGASP